MVFGEGISKVCDALLAKISLSSNLMLSAETIASIAGITVDKLPLAAHQFAQKRARHLCDSAEKRRFLEKLTLAKSAVGYWVDFLSDSLDVIDAVLKSANLSAISSVHDICLHSSLLAKAICSADYSEVNRLVSSIPFDFQHRGQFSLNTVPEQTPSLGAGCAVISLIQALLA